MVACAPKLLQRRLEDAGGQELVWPRHCCGQPRPASPYPLTRGGFLIETLKWAPDWLHSLPACRHCRFMFAAPSVELETQRTCDPSRSNTGNVVGT